MFFAEDPGKEHTRPFFEKRAKTKYDDTAVRLAYFCPFSAPSGERAPRRPLTAWPQESGARPWLHVRAYRVH